MDLTDQSIAIIVANEFEDIEMEYPLLNWSSRGADILLVPYPAGNSSRPYIDEKPVTGRFGTPCPPAVIHRYTLATLDELDGNPLDAVFFPGGFSPDALRTEQEVVDFIVDVYESGTLVTTICHGPQLLVETGILDGKTVTGYDAVRTDVINAGAEFVNEPVVTDGDLVTGRVPDDLPEFCNEVARTLGAE